MIFLNLIMTFVLVHQCFPFLRGKKGEVILGHMFATAELQGRTKNTKIRDRRNGPPIFRGELVL